MRALQFIVEVISNLIIMVLLVRLVLPFVHANFRNPVVQGIFKITSPLVVPLRRVLPPMGRVDTATLIVAYAFQYAALFLMIVLVSRGTLPAALPLAWFALIKLVVLLIKLFAYATIVRIILSWIAPNQYNPVTEIIGAITEPLIAPARRVIPSIGGLDLSPMFVTIGLFAVAILVEDLGAMVF
ncbi:MAG: YggT family protein [Pseudomonadota bacterium]